MNKKLCCSTLFAMLLAACGGSSSLPSQTSAPAPASQAASGKPSVGAPASIAAAAKPSASAASLAQQRALVLGGGGPLGRAWEVGMLKGFKDAGVDLTLADLLVGTSAGGILGTPILAGQAVDSVYNSYLAPQSSAAPAGPPPYDPVYAQQAVQPVTSVSSAADLTPALRVEVGRRALAASKVISEDAQLKAAATLLGDVRNWPSRPLKLAAADISDGTIRFLDQGSGATIEQAVAATSANPVQGKTPITIGGRRYIDGSVGGTNVDGAAGYGAIVALLPPALLQAQIAKQQVEALRAKGEKIIGLEPDADSLAAMGPDRFDLSRSRSVAEAAVRQAGSVAAEVRDLWLRGTSASSAAIQSAAN